MDQAVLVLASLRRQVRFLLPGRRLMTAPLCYVLSLLELLTPAVASHDGVAVLVFVLNDAP